MIRAALEPESFQTLGSGPSSSLSRLASTEKSCKSVTRESATQIAGVRPHRWSGRKRTLLASIVKMMLTARRSVLAAAVVMLLAGASYARGAPAQAWPVKVSAIQVNPKRPNIDGFLAARIAGKGAQKYLSVPEKAIPLLYATTSGARYERANFGRVRGIKWPYGLTAFRVRLFAGATVVEQLLFTHPGGRPRLE